MELGERVKQLRTQTAMTQKELSEELGVSTAAIRYWECGEKKPSMDAIISLAGVFGVTADYILGIGNKSQTNEEVLIDREKELLLNYRRLDSFGKKTVDTVCLSEAERVEAQRCEMKTVKMLPRYLLPSAAGVAMPFGGYDFEMIQADDTVPAGADFAVGIQGDSMFPYIHDGDTVYVKKTEELSVGDVGIFSVDGAMYCKQYYTDGYGNLTLISANPERSDKNIYVGAESGVSVKCFGKVLLGSGVPLPRYMTED